MPDLAEARPPDPPGDLEAEKEKDARDGNLNKGWSPLAWIADVSTGHPWKTLFIFLAIAVILVIPASQLETDTSMESLFGEDPDVNKHLEISEKFGEQQLITVVVDCTNSSRDVAEDYLEQLSASLRESEWFREIRYTQNMDFAGEKGILYLPEEHLYFLLDPNATTESILQTHSAIMSQMNQPSYLVSDNGNLYLLTMNLNATIEDMETRTAIFDGLYETIDDVTATDQAFQDLEVGFTGGMDVTDYEGDKMAMDDIFMTAGITFVLILVLLFVYFRSISLPMLSIIPIVLGIMATAGLVYVLFGELGMVTMIFAVLLLGLGVDFSIHLLSRFKDELEEGFDVPEAFRNTLSNTGKAIVVGCVTTAAAFGALSLSETDAMVEMGIISAAGLLITLICVFFTLPALVTLRLRRGGLRKKLSSGGDGFSILGTVGRVTSRFWWAFLILLVVIGGIFAIEAQDAEINSDIHELQPKNIPSYRQMEKIKENFDYSEDVLLCVVDSQEELLLAVSGFRSIPEVIEVESVLDYLPQNQESKLQILENAKMLNPGLSDVSWLNLKRMTWRNLPENIRDGWVSEGDGTSFLIRIRASGNLYDDEYREELLAKLERVEPEILGQPILYPKLINALADDLIRVFIYAAIPILLIVYIGFRRMNPIHTLLAMVPVLFGIGGVLALSEYTGTSLNLTSVLMIPLILGIGIDSGVHILHRYHEEGKGSVPKVVGRTGRAVFLTTATTCLAFGSLMFAEHPGIMSMGRVPVLGLTLSFLAAIFLLPALIRLLLERGHPESPAKASPSRKNPTPLGR
jgi:predicted RND superfamily exporter protein